jgi:hypothetical protein
MRHLLIVLLAVALTGCAYRGATPGLEDSAAAAPFALVVGTWRLVTVNEQPTPLASPRRSTSARGDHREHILDLSRRDVHHDHGVP